MPALLDETGTGILDEALGAMLDESEAGTLVSQFVSRATPLTSKTFTACSAAGDTFPTWYTTYLEVTNTGVSDQTCTVVTPGNIKGVAEADYQFTVPAHSSVEVGALPPHIFGHLAQITYSDATSLTIAVKRYGS